MQRIDTIIIGAGISGLTLAYLLEKQGTPYLLLEKNSAAGGFIRSTLESDFLAEWGPNTFMLREGQEHHAMMRLIRGLGLGDCLVEANPSSQQRYIWRENNLHEVPDTLSTFWKSDLISRSTKLKLLLEPLKKKRSLTDETVQSFVKRRLGQEILDYLIEPMLTGIYAGDVCQLGMASTLKTMFDWEQQSGSLLRGLLRSRGEKQANGRSRMKLYSLVKGMGSLTEALQSEIQKLEVNTQIHRIIRRDGDFILEGSQDDEAKQWMCQRLIIATGPQHASPLVENIDLQASNLLRQIPLAPIVSATIGFRQAQENIKQWRLPEGFGVLIPGVEDLSTLGVIFNSSLFPQRGPEDSVVMTAMLGGMRNPQLSQLADEEILRHLLAELDLLFGIRCKPDFVALHCYRGAIPQYGLGHRRIASKLEQVQSRVSGLYFTGNYIDGISVPHCIERAYQLADQLGQPLRAVRRTHVDNGVTEASPA